MKRVGWECEFTHLNLELPKLVTRLEPIIQSGMVFVAPGASVAVTIAVVVGKQKLFLGFATSGYL